MEALRIHKILEKDGEIYLTGLPFKKGQCVEMIMLIESLETPMVEERPPLTARQLLNSGLIGLWEDRTDIEDSAAYARYLREQSQQRSRG
ncbi:MAG: hypothetical protein ACUVV0_16085 [Anaerolineae bacterium]